MTTPANNAFSLPQQPPADAKIPTRMQHAAAQAPAEAPVEPAQPAPAPAEVAGPVGAVRVTKTRLRSLATRIERLQRDLGKLIEEVDAMTDGNEGQLAKQLALVGVSISTISEGLAGADEVVASVDATLRSL